ncbi:hypothetical protein HDV03_004457 [Kappamyces sp. JEL0829]|nr:hypothetical protein HDV03_004457 [Kappamyces sp. JEL0829]
MNQASPADLSYDAPPEYCESQDAPPDYGPPAVFPDAAGSSTGKDSSKYETYAIHYVGYAETLRGIALKYKVSPEAIQRANRLWTSDVIARPSLIIPGAKYSLQPEPTEENVRKTLVKKFQISTKCLDLLEARSYMIQYDYHLEQAIESYFADLKWEAQQPGPSSCRVYWPTNGMSHS